MDLMAANMDISWWISWVNTTESGHSTPLWNIVILFYPIGFISFSKVYSSLQCISLVYSHVSGIQSNYPFYGFSLALILIGVGNEWDDLTGFKEKVFG